MKLQHMCKLHFKTRIVAVKKVLANGLLKEVAAYYHIHPITLRRWIQRYQDGGEDNLKRKKTLTRHPKRLSSVLEREIVLLKEKNPGVTVMETHQNLRKKGIKVSTGAIRKVWNKYNLTSSATKGGPGGRKIEETPEIKAGLKEAAEYLDRGDTRPAAQTLNVLPSCSGKDILKKIPDRFLSLSKHLEKLYLTFYEIPFRKTARKAKKIREEAEKENLLYTSLQAGIIELHALDWAGNHNEQLLLTRRLKKKIEKIKGRGGSFHYLRLEILISEARALGKLERIREALFCIRTLENYCRSVSSPLFLGKLASVHSVIGSHKKARFWSTKCINRDKKNTSGNIFLAASLTNAAEYDSARKILKGLREENVSVRSLKAILLGLCSLGQGEIEEAMKFANQAISIAEEHEIPAYIWSSSFIISCCLCGLDQKKEALNLIARVGKQQQKLNHCIITILLNKRPLPNDATLMPPIKLLILLNEVSRSVKIKDYRKAFNYASTQQLMGYFHGYILFFPAIVKDLFVRGKLTGLPKSIRKLPVFNNEAPVYAVKFLGSFTVHKEQKHLRMRLRSKDVAFLIHLILKAGELGKRIPLNILYDNFWKGSQYQARNLSHVLMRIKKALKIPSHLLTVSHNEINPCLINAGIYFITDYSEFEQNILRAKAFQKIKKWGFAKKEYLRAFALFRGEPFEKMYDPWSEHMRRVILDKLETEAMHFAKSCLEHDNEIRQKKRRTPSAKCRGGNMTDAKKVLEKVLKIIPQSEESQKLLETLGLRR